MKKTINKSFTVPVGYGIFIASVILIIFSSFFSYQQEVGVLVAGMLTVSLLFIEKSFNTKNNRSTIENIFSKIFFFLVPLFLSFIIIKGDGRSWFLILIVILTCWLILFDKTNDEK